MSRRCRISLRTPSSVTGKDSVGLVVQRNVGSKIAGGWTAAAIIGHRIRTVVAHPLVLEVAILGG